MPWPGSRTTISTLAPASRTSSAITLGAWVNFAAFETMFESACVSRARSPLTKRRLFAAVTSSRCPPRFSASALAATTRLHQGFDRDLLADQRDLALGGAGHVDQLFDQAAEPADLALEDLAQADQDRVAALERAQHARGVGDRRQRVAQLVREHRQELALAPLGQAQRLHAFGQALLELLALVDLDDAADIAGEFATIIEARRAVVEHPAVLRRRGAAAGSRA